MAYIEIVKGKFGNSKMPDNVVRINRGTIGVAGNIASRFTTRRTTNPRAKTDREIVPLGLAYDPDTKRIKLLPDAGSSAYMFSKNSNSDSETLSCAKPKSLTRMGVEVADYLLVGPTENLEFQKQ